jgi:lysophospholipase L1-like esterase
MKNPMINSMSITPRARTSLSVTLILAFLCIGSATAQEDHVRKPMPVPANPTLPSLILVGDSTMRNGQGDGGGGQWGWGEPVADFFDSTKINVVNRGVGGVSSRTYITGGNWDSALGLIKQGDFVVIQFGHNESGTINDTLRARACIKGVGDETQEIDNQVTKQHEVVHTYGWYLRKFVDDSKSKGATVMIGSPIPRQGWTSGMVPRNESYSGWASEVAKQKNLGFIDMNEIIARKYEELGEAGMSSNFPPKEKVHTNRAGAELNAACFISGLKALKSNPLEPYFSPKAKAILPADLSKPDPAVAAVKSAAPAAPEESK